MTSRFTVFAQDRSERWILVPGVASTRQIEIRNDSDDAVECHLRVEQPASASASPAVLTIQPQHSRTADIIFLANWSPETENTVIAVLRDAQGVQLATFTHEVVAAESSDCSVGLELRDPILIDGVLAGFNLWFSITSRSATPRRFEVDFVPHPSLRFPERKNVTLAPGESTAFEVPVEWNRAVRDLHWWNHPMVIEVFVPVSRGRRAGVLQWSVIERKLSSYLTDDDRVAKVIPAAGTPAQRPDFAKAAGQLKYTELVELKKLEQAVVGGHVRTPLKPQEIVAKKSSLISFSTGVRIGLALFAFALAVLLFLRPPVIGRNAAPVHVTPAQLAAPQINVVKAHKPKLVASGAVAKPVWTTVAGVEHATTLAAVAASQEQTAAVTGSQASHPALHIANSSETGKTVAMAPHETTVRPMIDRDAVVVLNGVDASYASGGRAVNVAWTESAQSSATVEVLDFSGKIIASRTLRGDHSATTVRLPRGYHGSLSVQVIANGYHGERVVQSTSLTPGG